MPTCDAGAKGGGAAPARPALSNRDLLASLLSAVGDNVGAACRNWQSVKPIRKLMAEGCDLYILPELRQLACGSKPLQTWLAPWLHKQIRERRDAPGHSSTWPAPAAAARVFVAVETDD